MWVCRENSGRGTGTAFLSLVFSSSRNPNTHVIPKISKSQIESHNMLELGWKLWEPCFPPTCAQIPRGSGAAPFPLAQVCT